MSQYQRIEYLIGKDGKIVERAIAMSGNECLAVTAPLESQLGKIETRDLLPSYYQDSEQDLTIRELEQDQYLQSP
jgi:hypothetical protein